MRPKKGERTITLPLTFDMKYKSKTLKKQTLLTLAGSVLVWVVLTIFSILFAEGIMKLVFSLIAFIIIFYIDRKIIMRENYYRKQRERLIENDYQFEYNLFWQIFDIRKEYPYIYYYKNGLKAMFVSFEKDVIVGNTIDDEYNHYESLSEAYSIMKRKGIDCMHLDYMDSVGKDTRMDKLFENANNTENKELKEIMIKMYTHIQQEMKKAYATYDVYVFFTGSRVNDDDFIDSMEDVISYFNKANFLKYKIMSPQEVAALVKSLLNVDNFSVDKTSNKLFQGSNLSNYVTLISVVRNGKRIVVNKTKAQIQEENRIKAAERAAKEYARKSNKKGSKRLRALRNIRNQQEVDIFEDEYEEQNQQYYDNQGYEDIYYDTQGYEEYQEDYSNQGNQEEYDSSSDPYYVGEINQEYEPTQTQYYDEAPLVTEQMYENQYSSMDTDEEAVDIEDEFVIESEEQYKYDTRQTKSNNDLTRQLEEEIDIFD